MRTILGRSTTSSTLSRSGAVLVAALAVTAMSGLTASAAGPWSAPVSLSTPIPPTNVVEGAVAAVNAGGAEVVAWDDQAANGTQFVHVRTSGNGTTWSAATTFGHGVLPSVALAPDGRAVAVWVGLDAGVSGNIRASVRPPGGSWSPPVTVSGHSGHPQVAVDALGNALAVWASSTGSIETASLPAGGAWGAVQTLASAGTAPDLAVNASGAAVVCWTGTGGSIVAASGTSAGAFGTPVVVAAAAYRQNGVHVALNDSGQAALAWRGRTTDLASTRAANGTWAAPTVLATNVTGAAAGSVDVAIDGSGNAVAVFERLNLVGSGYTYPLYSSRRPAGGAWGPATLLSGATDSTSLPRITADPAGSFVAAWAGGAGLKAAISAPGGSFGAPVAVGPGFLGFDLAVAPGHAVLTFISGGATETHAQIA